MRDVQLYIDIEDRNGNKQGGGPILSASGWTYTARMDRAGSFEFTMPATDDKAPLVVPKYKARAWAEMGGSWREVGAGVIDHIDRTVAPDGTTLLHVSGDDEIRELAYRSVKYLDLANGGAGVTHAGAIAAINAFLVPAPLGWSILSSPTAPNDYMYGRFSGESVLAALLAIGDKTQTHFYRSGPRTLQFAAGFASSGMRAIRPTTDLLAAETCAIVELTQTIETFELLTRIYPFGAGNGDARLTLAPSNRATPAGHTISRIDNWLQNNAAVTQYGLIDAPWIEFKDVRPVSNTSADLQAASNMLFDLAVRELTRRATQTPIATYTVKVSGCSALLRPMQTLRLVYRDTAAGIVVDQDVNILEATWDVGINGIQTVALVLSTGDRWAQDDLAAVVDNIAESSVYKAHPQLNANSYVIPFSKPLDDVQTNPAQFRFRFDQEVTQLTRCVFDFQLVPLDSTVKTVASSSASTAASGDHQHTVTIGTHTHQISVSDHQHLLGAHRHNFPIYNGAFSSNVAVVGGLLYNSGGTTVTITVTDDTTAYTGGTLAGSPASASAAGGSSTPTSASGGSHTHTVTPALTTTYGIYRDDSANVFALGDLEYSMDGMIWHYFVPGINGFTTLGDGWYRVDLTPIVQDGMTLRPINNNNLLQIRRKASGTLGKKCTIDAQMNIRTIIQSIAYTG